MAMSHAASVTTTTTAMLVSCQAESAEFGYIGLLSFWVSQVSFLTATTRVVITSLTLALISPSSPFLCVDPGSLPFVFEHTAGRSGVTETKVP